MELLAISLSLCRGTTANLSEFYGRTHVVGAGTRFAMEITPYYPIIQN